MVVTDELGRSFRKLRVSVTENCNLACQYCVPEGETLINKSKLHPPADFFAQLIGHIHCNNPLQKIRLTGGEPTLYPYLATLVHQIKQIGITDVGMTTHGVGVAQKLPQLYDQGLTNINVSLDALSPEGFKKITKSNGVHKVLKTIATAKALGLQVKINTVVMKGMNENEILPLFSFAKENNIEIRFLEVMSMGHLFQEHMKEQFLQNDIAMLINQHYPIHKVTRQHHSTTTEWSTLDGFRFGMITNVSESFCGDCDRLRLDNKGYLYGCLSTNHGIDIKASLSSDNPTAFIRNALEQAISFKKTHHFSGSALSMRAIGG